MDHATKRNGKPCDGSRGSVSACAGLPFRGAPLLLPVDMNITVVTGGNALQFGINTPLLYNQLSPAGLSGLSSLAKSYRGQPMVREDPKRPSGHSL